MSKLSYLPPEPVLLSVEQAGKVLGVHRATVFALLRAGELDSIQIGRRRLVPIAAIHAFVEDRRG